jgi:hypothetical protein
MRHIEKLEKEKNDLRTALVQYRTIAHEASIAIANDTNQTPLTCLVTDMLFEAPEQTRVDDLLRPGKCFVDATDMENFKAFQRLAALNEANMYRAPSKKDEKPPTEDEQRIMEEVD